jgi:hypothetical protein
MTMLGKRSCDLTKLYYMFDWRAEFLVNGMFLIPEIPDGVKKCNSCGGEA